MGAVNYFTSDYITMGYNCNIDYCADDFDSVEEMDECRQFDIEELQDEIQSILNKYRFYYFHVALKPGYYEGFTLDIENNYSICHDGYIEKREAQKEITEIRKCLLECAAAGLVKCSPGWCTGYYSPAETVAAIKEAAREMREEVKNTPTWKQYETREGA